MGAPATVLLALVTAITATVVLLPRPAAADQISDLKSQATQIAQQLTQEQLQIGAFQQRYSVESAKVEQDGLTPQRVVLWRKPAAGWIYVALLVNPAKPGEICFTATFVASRFEITAPLVEKYFGAGALSE